MHRSQRRTALGMAAVYRTVSNEALLVLAGIPPIDLAARERTYVYEEKRRNGNVGEVRAAAAEKQMEDWQVR